MKIDWERFRSDLRPRELAGNFVQGLFLIGPLVVTLYVLLWVLKTVDGWLSLPVPGLGLLLTVAAVILVGRLASNVFVQSAIEWFEALLAKAPLIQLVYRSVQDLVAAFTGRKRRFDQPVLASLAGTGEIEVVGFITREDMGFLGRPGRVAVYLPHSYAISGQVVLLPPERVRPLKQASAEMMSFVVSGGIAAGGEAPAE